MKIHIYICDRCGDQSNRAPDSAVMPIGWSEVSRRMTEVDDQLREVSDWKMLVFCPECTVAVDKSLSDKVVPR